MRRYPINVLGAVDSLDMLEDKPINAHMKRVDWIEKVCWKRVREKLKKTWWETLKHDAQYNRKSMLQSIWWP